MTTPAFSLIGKTAIITGASRGIGEAAARLFVKQGAQVIISSRRQESLDELAEVINQEGHPGKVFGLACHIGNSESVVYEIVVIFQVGIQTP